MGEIREKFNNKLRLYEVPYVFVLLFKGLCKVQRLNDFARHLTFCMAIFTSLIFGIITMNIAIKYSNPVLLWQHTIKQAPRPQAAWEQLGGAYDAENVLAPAWFCYQKCLEIEPEFNIARVNLGIVNMKLGLIDDAIRQFNQEKNNPYHGANVSLYLGSIYKSRKDHNKALLCFEEAHHKHPDRADIALNLGRQYNLLKQYQAACQTLEPFANSSVHALEMTHELGYTYSQLGQLEKARVQYLKYLRQKPNDAMVLNSLGVVFAKQGDIQQAATYFARACSIAPDFEEALDNLKRTRSKVAPSTNQ